MFGRVVAASFWYSAVLCDADVEKIVTLLVSAGFLGAAKPDYEKRTPIEIAKEKKWPLTAKALGNVK